MARPPYRCPLQVPAAGADSGLRGLAISGEPDIGTESGTRPVEPDPKGEQGHEIGRSEALHRTLAANLPDTSVFLLDRDLRILLADGEAIRRLPWLDEDMFRDRKVSDLYAEVPDEVLKLCVDNYRAALEGERREFEFSSDGFHFAIQAVPVRGDGGDVEAALVVARDVTESALAKQQVARRGRHQDAIAELGRFALQSLDLNELLEEAVGTARATLEVEIAGVLELDPDDRTLCVAAATGLPDSHHGKRIPLDKSAGSGYTIETREPVIVEDLTLENRFPQSPDLIELGVVSSLIVPIEGYGQLFGVLNVHARERREFSDDDVAFLTAVATLIVVAVERDRRESATRHAAMHDPLTSLPNRPLAVDRLTQALARRRREGIDVAVLTLDLDRFKVINDSLGHAAGDEVLLALAPRLAAAVRPTDTVARLSGDEFVVICPDVGETQGAIDVAERIADAIRDPLEVASGVHFLTASTGITLAGPAGDSPESLLRDAGAAMYRAKERGRGRYELFDEGMRAEVLARVEIEAGLRSGLARGELEAWFQPVIDLGSRRIVSTEALARWRHPDRGLIPPAEFIPVAEESGLIVELGLEVLEQACYQTAEWQRRLDPTLGLSVNVSARQMINPAFPGQVAGIAERSGVRAGTLSLEITETMLMEEADSPAVVLETFREHGLALALDDFGTGYSSLSRLKSFPLDVLKIDRSFVSGATTNTEDRAIVRATIDMAHAVGLSVVAEGVETAEQEKELRAAGCDRAQGYLYARPQPPQATADLLTGAQPLR